MSSHAAITRPGGPRGGERAACAACARIPPTRARSGDFVGLPTLCSAAMAMLVPLAGSARTKLVAADHAPRLGIRRCLALVGRGFGRLPRGSPAVRDVVQQHGCSAIGAVKNGAMQGKTRPNRPARRDRSPRRHESGRPTWRLREHGQIVRRACGLPERKCKERRAV